jgi:hypothetical protein
MRSTRGGQKRVDRVKDETRTTVQNGLAWARSFVTAATTKVPLLPAPPLLLLSVGDVVAAVVVAVVVILVKPFCCWHGSSASPGRC